MILLNLNRLTKSNTLTQMISKEQTTGQEDLAISETLITHIQINQTSID